MTHSPSNAAINDTSCDELTHSNISTVEDDRPLADSELDAVTGGLTIMNNTLVSGHS
jgi:hypothetical protein